jgi:hypothetical protein
MVGEEELKIVGYMTPEDIHRYFKDILTILGNLINT